MKAQFIYMEKIVERKTVKVLAQKDYTVDFICKRMYESWAKMNEKTQTIEDLELGCLAKVIETKKDPGSWHNINPTSFIKPNCEVEPFYDDTILSKTKKD